MALPFMRAESEENATQAMAFISIVGVTIGLAVFNVCGAIAGSQSENGLELFIRLALALILVGAEFLAAVALVRVMLAPNRLRKVVGTVIFLGLAWACIQNGKRAAHLIFPEFAESSSLLAAKAEIAGSQAQEAAEARAAAIESTPAELSRTRARIATLENEQLLMQAQSPEKIEEAQAALIAQGKYFAAVDGIRGPETEKAMRARGEEIRREIETLRRLESNLSRASTTIQQGAATAEDTLNPAVLQADLEERARKAREATIWLEVMLWVFEGARSFGLWVFVTTITSRNKSLEEQERIARSEAARKGWQTRKARGRGEYVTQAGSKSDTSPEAYWSDTVDDMLAWRRDRQPKVTLKRLVEKFGAGRTEHEFINDLGYAVKQGWVSQARHDQLLQVPAAVNGAEHEDDPSHEDDTNDRPDALNA